MPDLFGIESYAPQENLLPVDGDVFYIGPVFEVDAERYFNELYQDVPWQHDTVKLYGKTITTARKYAWYGDKPYSYQYSGTRRIALPWLDVIKQIKDQVTELTGYQFNACLLNLYPSGNEGMSWHTDNEIELVKGAAIASVSLGATRRFDFKHKSINQKVQVQLDHGSLLIMSGTTQQNWLHQLPKSKKVTTPRINLTYRLMRE